MQFEKKGKLEQFLETDQLKIVTERTANSSEVVQPVATFVGVICSITAVTDTARFFINNSCYCNKTERVSR